MTTERTNGCVGLCCESFVLHAGDIQVTAEIAAKWLLDFYRGETVIDEPVRVDQFKIFGAFTPVSNDRFTCKWFNPDTKMCSDYANRPQTCRDFGRQCSQPGCTYGRKSE